MKALLLAGLLYLSVAPASLAAQPPTACGLVERLPVSFSGIVEVAGPARWQVAGQTVDVDADTVFSPPGGAAPGEWAAVTAWWRLDGLLQATRIETASAPVADPLLRLIGLVEAIAPGQWTVGGTPVAVTPETILVGEGEVGSVALVQAWQASTPPRALLIAGAPPGDDPVFLDGVLLAVDGDLWLVQTGAAAVEVSIAGAFVQGAVEPGRGVQVMAVERSGQPARALYAAVTPSSDERAYFGGRLIAQITATQPEQWLLLAASDQGPWLELRTLSVDRLAVPIDETAGPAVPGAWIEAAAHIPQWLQQPWVARSLRVDLAPQGTVAGEISANGEGVPARWQVGDTCVIVDPHTAVDGRPRVERYAIARGARLGPSVLWAGEAAVRYRFAGVLAGRLAHVTPQMWMILVTPPSHVDASQPTRVYLTIDATSLIDPSLLTGVLGIPVAVQARAGQGGWLADWVDDPASPWQPRLPVGH